MCVSPPLQEARSAKTYMIPLYACVPLHLGMLLAGCTQACHLARDPALFLGVSLSIACSGGLGFTTAHELLHGRTVWDKILANILLCPLFYMHWTLSHLCHHQKVLVAGLTEIKNRSCGVNTRVSRLTAHFH